MPGFKQHLAISAVAGAGTYLFMCDYYSRRPDFGEFLVCEAVGLLTGAAPDALEPALDPNHRAFGHSVALGTGLVRLAVTKCAKENGDWQQFVKILLAVATVSYICHLIADGFTAKGLPLLGC